MRAGVAFYECVNRSKNERPLIFATWLREESELAQRTLYMNQ